MHPGTQLWALALGSLGSPNFRCLPGASLDNPNLISYLGWKSFKNRLFHKKLLTPAFSQTINPIDQCCGESGCKSIACTLCTDENGVSNTLEVSALPFTGPLNFPQ